MGAFRKKSMARQQMQPPDWPKKEWKNIGRRYAGIRLIAPPWAKPPETNSEFTQRAPMVDNKQKR